MRRAAVERAQTGRPAVRDRAHSGRPGVRESAPATRRHTGEGEIVRLPFNVKEQI